jgi:acyl-CoA synthetase (AMP-forming)/AMP-acid ligase II
MSFSDWLGECAGRHPERIAVLDATSGRRHSFRGFDERANQIAHFCEQWVGLLPGDCIGLLSTPSDDVLQIVVAAGKLGLAALVLDPASPPEALVASLAQYDPRTVFHGLAQAPLVQEIWFEVDSVEHFIPLRGAVDTANFEDIVTHYSPVPPPVELEGQTAWVHYGTEGITWRSVEDAASDAWPDGGPPLHRPDGLGAAVKALQTGRCVVVEEDAIRVIESPTGIGPTEDGGPASERNIPTGRSWLPHEFR